MLFMEHELDVTLLTIAHLVGQLGDGVSLSVLHNGRGLAGKVGAEIDALDGVHFYEAGENLGVAGGRNYLLRTDECEAADVVMLIDNDVIPPVDYVRRSAEFLLRRDDTGVVGSSVVLFLDSFNRISICSRPRKACWGRSVYALRESRHFAGSAGRPGVAVVRPPRRAPRLERGVPRRRGPDRHDLSGGSKSPRSRRFYPLRKSDPSIREATHQRDRRTRFSVSTIAGCCQTFRRSLGR